MFFPQENILIDKNIQEKITADCKNNEEERACRIFRGVRKEKSVFKSQKSGNDDDDGQKDGHDRGIYGVPPFPRHLLDIYSVFYR